MRVPPVTPVIPIIPTYNPPQRRTLVPRRNK